MDSATAKELKEFLKQRGISMKYAAAYLECNYNSLRVMLSRNDSALKASTDLDLAKRAGTWIYETLEDEQLLFTALLPHINKVPRMAAKHTLRTLLKDIDAV